MLAPACSRAAATIAGRAFEPFLLLLRFLQRFLLLLQVLFLMRLLLLFLALSLFLLLLIEP